MKSASSLCGMAALLSACAVGPDSSEEQALPDRSIHLWIDQLGDPRPSTRDTAARLLKDAGESVRPALDGLLRRLESSRRTNDRGDVTFYDDQEARKGVYRLVHSCADLFHRYLQDRSPIRRFFACEALWLEEPGRVIPACIALLREENTVIYFEDNSFGITMHDTIAGLLSRMTGILEIMGIVPDDGRIRFTQEEPAKAIIEWETWWKVHKDDGQYRKARNSKRPP